jgi:hypothetical protein
VHPCTGRTAPKGSRGIALPFLDHGSRRGEGSASRPGRSLPPGKTRYSLYRRLGGPQGWCGQVRKISPPPGFDPRTVQPVDSRYTDYATRPTIFVGIMIINLPLQKCHRKKTIICFASTVYSTRGPPVENNVPGGTLIKTRDNIICL